MFFPGFFCLFVCGDVIHQVSGIPPFFTFLIGIICSLLGIGGGELMGPLMLQMGLLPQVGIGFIMSLLVVLLCCVVLYYSVVCLL